MYRYNLILHFPDDLCCKYNSFSRIKSKSHCFCSGFYSYLPHERIRAGAWGVHGAVIGRYERKEVKPSIEMATQLAEVLKISLDYLVGSTDVLLEKNIVSKILDIQKLKENDRQHVFALLDAFLKQTKLQSIM